MDTPCSICHDFRGIGDFWDPAKEIRQATRNHIRLGLAWSDLTTSAESCENCEILVKGCKGCFQQHAISQDQILHCHLSFYYQIQDQDDDNYLEDVDKELFFRLKDGSWFTVQIFYNAEEEDPLLDNWESFPGLFRTSPGTGSDEAFETAKEWIETCEGKSHRHCRSPKCPILPKRVVDVGLQDGLVRLVEPEGATGKYFCLSHCWGPSQITTTTTANIMKHLRDIPLDSLPKTFQDAILLTRRFGIRYIWIDSLCIVQDDKNDWKIESSKMATIYQNAHLTIAATLSSSGAGGLYTTTPEFEVSGTSPAGQAYSLYFRQKIDHHSDNAGGVTGGQNNQAALNLGNVDDRQPIGHPTITYHPLLTRAWVFQERMLSTRVLHFGPYELFFECRTESECECGGIQTWGSSYGIPASSTKLAYSDALSNHRLRQRIYTTEREMAWVSRIWRTLVSSYNSLNITMPLDRLPAIGGLARSMASTKASPYRAGLWESSMNDDLLWAVENSAGLKPRPCPRSAPTWSWASVNTPSWYFDEIIVWDPYIEIIESESTYKGKQPNHLVDVVSSEVVPDGPDEFGLISQGSLKLSGAVAQGTLERDVQVSGMERNFVYYVSLPGTRLLMKPDYLFDHKGPDQVVSGTKVLCMRMSAVLEGSREVLFSLVLRPLAEPDTFERVGTLFIEARPPPVDVDGGVYDSAGVRTVVIR